MFFSRPLVLGFFPCAPVDQRRVSQEKWELLQLCDVVLNARRATPSDAQFFGATVHFTGKPEDRTETQERDEQGPKVLSGTH